MGLGSISLDQLVFDPTQLADGNSVGAFVRANDGTLITYHVDSGANALDVHITNTTPISVSVSNFPSDTDEHNSNAAYVAGDPGEFVLAVRQDTLANSITADGDYGAFKVNNRGALWTAPVGTVADNVADTENPVKVGSRSITGALAASSANNNRADLISDKFRRVYVNTGADIGIKNQAAAVTSTAAVLIASSLSGRRSIMIQNLSNRAIWIGKDTNVTNVNGMKVPAGQVMDMDLGEDVSVWAISDAATADVRVLELA
jgi:hypothetical protein